MARLSQPGGSSILSEGAYRQANLQIFLAALISLTLATLVGALLKRAKGQGRAGGVVANYKRPRALVVVYGRRHRPGLYVGQGGHHHFVRLYLVLLPARIHQHALHAPRRPLGDSGERFFIILPWQYALIWTEWHNMYTILIPVYAFLFLPILSALHEDSTRFLERTRKCNGA